MSERFENRAAAGRAAARPEELRELRRLMTAVFGSTAEAEAWLHTSVPALRGQTPISIIRQGEPERVTAVLIRMERGAFR